MPSVFSKYIIPFLQSNQVWLLTKQADPRKWGRFGWSSIIGFVWYACFREPSLMPIVYRILHLVPTFLLCRYCSRHFYEYQIRHPLDIQKWSKPMIFHWICRAYYRVHDRMHKCKEQCSVQMWINDQIKDTVEWYDYFHCRFRHRSFRIFWVMEVLIFYTTILKCVDVPENWNDMMTWMIRRYMSDVVSMLASILEEDDKQIATVPKTNIKAEWNEWWNRVLLKGCNQNKQLVDMIWNLCRCAIPTYKPH
jgi:hypothetical protein